ERREEEVRRWRPAERDADAPDGDGGEAGGGEEDAEPFVLEAEGDEVEPRLVAALDVVLPEPVEERAVRCPGAGGKCVHVGEEAAEEQDRVGDSDCRCDEETGPVP